MGRFREGKEGERSPKEEYPYHGIYSNTEWRSFCEKLRAQEAQKDSGGRGREGRNAIEVLEPGSGWSFKPPDRGQKKQEKEESTKKRKLIC